MRARVMAWIGLTVLWLGASFLGAVAALQGTPPGRAALVTSVMGALNRQIAGRVELDTVSGSPWSGLRISNLVVRDPGGDVVATIGSLRVVYGLTDLFAGRIVLGRLALTDVDIDLLQPARGEPFTVVAAFATAEDTLGTPRGAPRLIAFRNVTLRNVRLTIRTPAGPGDSLARVEAGPRGPLRVRTIEAVSADLPYLQLTNPLAPHEPIRVAIGSLAAGISDPAVTIVDAQGTAALWPDSVVLDLRNATLPASEIDLVGTIAWPDGPVLLDLTAEASTLRTDDLRGIVPPLPAGLVGSGRARIHADGSDVLLVDAESLDLTGLGGGGRVRGRLGLRLGPDGAWAQRGTDLHLDGFDLEYIRHLLDTLPVAGRVTGSVQANGPQERLRLGLNVVFRDSLVPGWPWNEVQGSGVVQLGVPGGFVFRDFQLARADLSLETVKRLVPAILLVGRVQGTGVLQGPWLEAEYRGTLHHVDLPLAASRASGSLRMDATGDVVGLWASLVFDSLQLAGLETTMPQLPLEGAFAGRVDVAGYLDSLLLDAELAGPAGTLVATGPLFFGADSLGAHELAVQLRSFDPAVVRPDLPPMELNGSVVTAGWWRDAQMMDMTVVATLGRSVVQGAPVDSMVAELGYTGDRLVLDTLDVGGFRFWATASGVLERGGDGDKRLRFAAETDSLGVLEDIVTGVLGSRPDADTIPASGRVTVAGSLAGSLSAPDVTVTLGAHDVRRGDLHLVRGAASASLAGESRHLAATVTVDSAAVGGLQLGALALRVTGRTDSLSWALSSRAWSVGRVWGGGHWQPRSGGHAIGIDSLAAQLVSGTWRTEGTTISWVDSGVTLSGLEAVNVAGPGRVTASGRIPFSGPGDFVASLESIAMSDIWLLLGRDHRSVSGWLGGTFEFTGTARSPIIGAMVGLRDVRLGRFSAPQVTSVLRYEERRLVGNLEARRLGESILNVDVVLPLDLAVVAVERRRLPGVLSVRARADSVDLALLNAITPLVRDATGTFDANFGLTGTWEDPELTGAFAIKDGGAAFPALGVRHEALNGSFSLAGDTIHIDSFGVRSGGGTASVGGYVRLEELSRPIVNIRIQAQEFHSVDIRNFLTVVASGDVSLTGPVIGATLRGKATVTHGVLHFADLLNKEVVDLDNPLYRDFVDTTQIRKEGLGTAFEVRLLDSLRIDSLELEMSRDMWLRSAEANIQLAGRIIVDREGDRYLLNGNLETPRGFYRLELLPTVSREFQVTGGQVRYFGTPDLNADLDVAAQHIVRPRRGDNVTVSVRIGGTLYEPMLTLSSDVNPPLSDTEIISYLLFGAPSVQAREGQQAAEIVTERLYGALSGQIGSTLISDVGIPLDYVQIRPASSGGVFGLEADFGKQFMIFGRPAFLTATPLYCSRETSDLDIGASLEYRLTRRWLLAASIDPARKCSFASATTLRYQFGLDLFWESGR